MAAGDRDGAARRSRLREYQEQLLERMQAARTSTGARAHQLGVEIGGTGYLLELTETGEIVPVPPLAAVPLTRPWYLGLANIRGALVGVVDLARYLAEGRHPEAGNELAASQRTLPSSGSARLVTFSPLLGFPCALLVARVVGLRHAAAMTVQEDCLVDADGAAWIPLSLAALAAQERFLQVALEP